MNLLLVGSILLVSNAHGSVWPQHGSLPLVPPATGAILTANSLDATIVQPVVINSGDAKGAIVAGPNSGTTIVKGSVAGPVTIRAGSSATVTSGIVPLLSTHGSISEGSIAVEGPSDGSITVTGGVDGPSTTAVVGPSTGPVVVAGPDAVPVPAIPVVVPVPGVDRTSEANVGVIGATRHQVLIKEVTSDATVIQGSVAGPLILQEILVNPEIVREPKVKLLTAPPATVAVAAGSPKIAISGPSTGNVAIAGPRPATTVVSGPSGTISTSGRK